MPAANGQDTRYVPCHATIAHQVLQIEEIRLADAGLNARYDSIYRFLDDITERASEVPYDPEKNSPDYARATIRRMHGILLDEGMIFGQPATAYHLSLKAISRNDNVFLSMRQAERRQTLQRPAKTFRLADCDVSMLLYLAMADKLKLPVTAIWMPTHMALRWQLPGNAYINFETQYARPGPDDEGYRRKYNIRPADEGLFEYLKPLQPDGLKAVYYMMFALKNDNYPPAGNQLKETFLAKGLALRPDWPLLRVAYIKQWIESGDSTLAPRAIALADGLTDIRPAHDAYLQAYAYAAIHSGKPEVRRLLEDAARNHPLDGYWQYLLGYADMKMGQIESACAGFNKARELGYKGFWKKEVKDFVAARCVGRSD